MAAQQTIINYINPEDARDINCDSSHKYIIILELINQKNTYFSKLPMDIIRFYLVGMIADYIDHWVDHDRCSDGKIYIYRTSYIPATHSYQTDNIVMDTDYVYIRCNVGIAPSFKRRNSSYEWTSTGPNNSKGITKTYDYEYNIQTNRCRDGIAITATWDKYRSTIWLPYFDVYFMDADMIGLSKNIIVSIDIDQILQSWKQHAEEIKE